MGWTAVRRRSGLAVCAVLAAGIVVAGCGSGAAAPAAGHGTATPAAGHSTPAPAAANQTAAPARPAGASQSHASTGSAATQAPAAGPTVRIGVEPLHSSSPPYTATLHVPTLTWSGHTATAAKVTHAIQSWVDARVAAFTQGVQRDLANAHSLPKSLPESSLTLTAKTALVNGRVASFSFVEEPFYRGEASPAQEPHGLTFDLKTGRQVALAGLFRGGAGYLGTLARLATADLASFHPAGAHCYLGKGPAAAAASFRAWWLSPSGLVLSFPAGQYTAAYCGPPRVTLTPSQLKSIARSGGLLAALQG